MNQVSAGNSKLFKGQPLGDYDQDIHSKKSGRFVAKTPANAPAALLTPHGPGTERNSAANPHVSNSMNPSSAIHSQMG